MTILRTIAAGAAATVGLMASASAATVNLTASDDVVLNGDTVEVAVTFTADDPAEFLVDSLFEIDFDAGLFGFVSADFATDELQFEEEGVFEAAVTSEGILEVSAASFDFLDVLSAGQSDAFTVVTLTFEALANGEGTFSLTDLSTFLFASGLDGDLFEATINVASADVEVVPLPGAIVFLLTGVAGLAARRRLAA